MIRTIAAALMIAIQVAVLLAKDEPHHHLAYEDASLRVLRVHVAGHDTTFLHRHDPDYLWVSIGNSDITNAKPGSADAIVRTPNLGVHFSAGHFDHVARNRLATSFDNITVELLQSQTNAKNRCELVVADQPTRCPAVVTHGGVTTKPLFETDQMAVSMVSLAPQGLATTAAGQAPQWVIAIDTLQTKGQLALDGNAKWTNGVFRPVPKSAWQLRNRGLSTARVLILTAKR